MSASAASPTDDRRRERYIATAWPSIARFAVGRLLGRGYAIQEPRWSFVSPGNLLALATSPLGATLYLAKLLPFVCRRYVLTDARIAITNGVTKRPGESLAHDAYDAIEVETLPGQAWYDSADLVFRKDREEVLRLSAVASAEIFRRTIWEARETHRQLRSLLDESPAAA